MNIANKFNETIPFRVTKDITFLTFAIICILSHKKKNHVKTNIYSV